MAKKERWVWTCDYDNHSSAWADREICRAKSKHIFPTEEEATKALERHIKRSWHPYYVGRYGSVRGDKYNSRRSGHVFKLEKYYRWKKDGGWRR